jgi:GST-like protein
MADDKPLILYGVGSPNVRKVGLMLEELGLSYELRFVPVFKGEQFTPEFLAMNPLGKVPVLVDPALGEPLFESGAILFYLAERHGKFLPAEGAARYQVMQWLMVQMANIGPMFGQLTHFRFALGAGAQPYAEGRYAEQARRLYQLLDDRLRTREWIAGSSYSIADMATYHWSTYLEKHGFDPKNYPSLVLQRPYVPVLFSSRGHQKGSPKFPPRICRVIMRCGRNRTREESPFVALQYKVSKALRFKVSLRACSLRKVTSHA